jgi:hypothetical protein
MTVQTKKISPTYVSFYVAGSDSVDVPINFGHDRHAWACLRNRPAASAGL